MCKNKCERKCPGCPSERIIHPEITCERVMEAVEDGGYIGFCTNCGEEQSGVELDACEYECDSCEADTVYGALELLSWFDDDGNLIP